MIARLPVLVITIVIIASAASAGDASHGSFTSLPDREFQVLGAQWGTGHRWADVTDQACELATDAGLDVAASRTHFGDPYPHFKKSLVVFYLWRGELRSATTHENGRLRIPVRDEPGAAALVRKSAMARVARLASAIQAGQAKAGELLGSAVRAGSIDGIRKAVRKRRKLTKDLGQRLGPEFEELDEFFHRHRSLAGHPGVKEIRAAAAALRAGLERWEKFSRHALENMREATVNVSSCSDWRNLDVVAVKGDLVVFEAKGSWKLCLMR
jgi:hypothetical protein